MDFGPQTDGGPNNVSVTAHLVLLARQQNVPASDCDDCVNEALIALWRQHPDWTLKEPTTLNWLSLVVIRRARLYHRRLKRRSVPNADLDRIPSYDAVPDTDEGIGEQARRQDSLSRNIHIALNRLSDLNREIFTRRAMLSLTYQEIGQEFGLSAEQVRLRYYRTRRRLAREYTQPGGHTYKIGGEGRGRGG